MKKKFLFLIALILISILLVLFALFIGNTYTIRFNSNGGNRIENIYVKTGKGLVLPKKPVKEGYIFIEWHYKNKKITNGMKVRHNMILDAIWAKRGEYGDYKVTFDSNGGSKINAQLVLSGDKVVKPDNPSKKGYKFKGWYLNNKKYDFNKEVKKNITLKAKYEKQD